MDVHSPYHAHVEYRLMEQRQMLAAIVETIQRPHRSRKTKASGPISYTYFNDDGMHKGKFILPKEMSLQILPWQVYGRDGVYAAYTAGICGDEYIGVQFHMPVFIHPPGRLITPILEQTLVERVELMVQPVRDFMEQRFERVAEGYLRTPEKLIERMF